MPLPARIDGREYALRIPAIDPVVVGEVGRADLDHALALISVAGGAIRREHLLSGWQAGLIGLAELLAGQRAHIGRHRSDVIDPEHAVAAESHHLRDARVLI